MTSHAALNSDQIGNLGVGVIIGLVVIGALLGLVVRAAVGRVVILAVVVGLGALVWQQRATIQDRVTKCELDMSFVGIDVQAPDDVVQKCRASQRFTR